MSPDRAQFERWRRDAERMSNTEWEGNYHGREVARELFAEIDRLRGRLTHTPDWPCGGGGRIVCPACARARVEGVDEPILTDADLADLAEIIHPGIDARWVDSDVRAATPLRRIIARHERAARALALALADSATAERGDERS